MGIGRWITDQSSFQDLRRTWFVPRDCPVSLNLAPGWAQGCGQEYTVIPHRVNFGPDTAWRNCRLSRCGEDFNAGQLGAPLPTSRYGRVPGLRNDRQERREHRRTQMPLLGVGPSSPLHPSWIPRKGYDLAAVYLNTCPVGTDSRGKRCGAQQRSILPAVTGINSRLFALFPGEQPGMPGWGPGQQVGTQSPGLGEPEALF